MSCETTSDGLVFTYRKSSKERAKSDRMHKHLKNNDKNNFLNFMTIINPQI